MTSLIYWTFYWVQIDWKIDTIFNLVKTVFPANNNILIRKIRIDGNPFLSFLNIFPFAKKRFPLKIKENWRYKENKKLKIGYPVETNIEFLTRRTFCKAGGGESFKKFNFSSKLSFNLITDNWIHPRTDSFSFVFPSNFRSTISQDDLEGRFGRGSGIENNRFHPRTVLRVSASN